jgi:hypothetical protein
MHVKLKPVKQEVKTCTTNNSRINHLELDHFGEKSQFFLCFFETNDFVLHREDGNGRRPQLVLVQKNWGLKLQINIIFDSKIIKAAKFFVLNRLR